jgi:hypothetical protein
MHSPRLGCFWFRASGRWRRGRSLGARFQSFNETLTLGGRAIAALLEFV